MGAFPGAGSGKRDPGLMKYPRSPGLLPGAVSVGESIPPHTAGRVRIQKSAQNGCSFTQNFGIRQDCPRITVFPGKSGFSKTLIYAFGRQISLRIGLGYLEMKRRGVLAGRSHSQHQYQGFCYMVVGGSLLWEEVYSSHAKLTGPKKILIY